jgi:hypothetical protein
MIISRALIINDNSLMDIKMKISDINLHDEPKFFGFFYEGWPGIWICGTYNVEILKYID